MPYKFYGWDTPDVKPTNENYVAIKNQRDLYDKLNGIWCQYSCAPRYRSQWSLQNKTLGQCSITAFLAQEIFGGEVFGVPLADGGVHCYNVVGDVTFDLTSEQFGDEALVYDHTNKQLFAENLCTEEKQQRFRFLRDELQKSLR